MRGLVVASLTTLQNNSARAKDLQDRVHVVVDRLGHDDDDDLAVMLRGNVLAQRGGLRVDRHHVALFDAVLRVGQFDAGIANRTGPSELSTSNRALLLVSSAHSDSGTMNESPVRMPL